MSYQDRIRVTYQDLNNESGVNLIYTAPNTVSGVLTDLAILLIPLTSTNIVMVGQDTAVVGPDVATGGTGDYPTVDDMCTLEFEASNGNPMPITWPGIVLAALKPDHSTVDPTQVDVAAFITWCLANATTKDGFILVEYKRGWRWNLST